MSETYTVLTTMKNEGAFLLEWVAHHKALGFDKLLICTNDCEDSTSDMVVRLQRMGLARHHATAYQPGHSSQRNALRQALRYPEVRGADWIYVCDADEFLSCRVGDGSARALVAAGSAEVEAISVPWRQFGTNGEQSYQEGMVTRQFPMASASSGPKWRRHAFAKSLFRGDLIPRLARIGVHAPVPAADQDPPLRREVPGGSAPDLSRTKLHVQADYSVAQVNHYQLRSRDSFLVKAARGKVNHTQSKIEFDYWQANDINEERCDLIRRYDEAVAWWMAELLADPRLAMLHHRAIRWHRSKIAEIHASPDFAEMINQIEGFRSRMAKESPENTGETAQPRRAGKVLAGNS